MDFLSLIQTSLVVNDGGACTVDKSNADLYLKMIEKVVTLYKVYSCKERVWRILFYDTYAYVQVDTTGMMFEDDSTNAAAAAAAAQQQQSGVLS